MPELLSGFNFEVVLSPSGQGGDEALSRIAAFSAVSGLDLTLDLEELAEGGYNHGRRRLVKGARGGDLTLKRGLTQDAAFWSWVQRCLSGPYPLPYVDGEIRVYPALWDSGPPARYRFRCGIASSVKGPALEATGTSVPIEELVIAHEGLSRVGP